jgi:transcriptional regulator with XRE-family HTH domain
MKQVSLSGMHYMRIELGITQQQLADMIGVSRSLVAMAERGTRSLPGSVLPQLKQLYGIANKVPYTPKSARRQRPSVARQRPPYNRIRFSTRTGRSGRVQIVTINNSLPILSAQDLQMTAKRMTLRSNYDSKIQPSGSEASRELLVTLEQNQATLRCRLEVMELDKTAARVKAIEVKAGLMVIKAILKAYRYNFKTYPPQRKKWRKAIAVTYVKKLELQQRLEKYNKPSIVKRKTLIEQLEQQLHDQQQLAQVIQQSLLKPEEPGMVIP